ncbi:unnamed protein product, partial [Laminaria digitata]
QPQISRRVLVSLQNATSTYCSLNSLSLLVSYVCIPSPSMPSVEDVKIQPAPQTPEFLRRTFIIPHSCCPDAPSDSLSAFLARPALNQLRCSEGIVRLPYECHRARR